MTRVSWRSAALAAVTLVAVILLAACSKSSNGKVKDFVSDLNKHDLKAAMSLTTPNFTLTQANGTTVQGAAAQNALGALPTPIKIVSIPHKGGRTVSATLTFGSGPATSVDFTGSSKSKGDQSGHIAAMKISAS